VRRVLVVEDEESFSDALSYMLRREGFEVVVCPTGPDALAALDRAGVDLVLLDLMLRRPSGVEVCRALRERWDVPVIMLIDSEVDKAAGLGLGVDGYVSKPFSWREIVSQVRAVIGGQEEPGKWPSATSGAAPVRPDLDGYVVTIGGLES
jgi:two-component system, OmpR family, response regulator RegX3